MPTPLLDNRQLGTDTARLNLLTNGGFEIWQRGNGPFTANGAYTSDRWYINSSSGYSVSRDTTNVDTSSLAALALVATSPPAGNAIYQKIEDYLQLRGRTLTFSLRIRTSTASAVRVTLYDNVGGDSYSAFHTGDGTWQTLTVTKAIPAGTTVLAVGFNCAVSCTAYVDNAMLVVGSQVADYAPLHPADDLARCLRYYEIFGMPSSASIVEIALGQCFSTTNALIYLRYTKKPVTPTISVVGSPQITNSVGQGVALSSAAATNVGDSSGGINVGSGGGLVAGNITRLYSANTNQYVVAESNP